MKKKTHEEFIKELKIINPNIEIIGKYSKSNIRIKCKCLVCNYEWEALPHCLIYAGKHNMNSCPCCNGRHLLIGHTDLWTTHPNVAKMLVNASDGYKYTKSSEVKVDWICPECGTKHDRDVNAAINVLNKGLEMLKTA